MPEHIVGKTSDIDEGTGKTFTIEGQTIAVFNKSGEIFANLIVTSWHLVTQHATSVTISVIKTTDFLKPF